MFQFYISLIFSLNFFHYGHATVISFHESLEMETMPISTIATNQTRITENTCNCGLFLGRESNKKMVKPPTDQPLLLIEPEETYSCTYSGTRRCQTKCLEILTTLLQNNASYICASVDHDIFKERVFLFLKNCHTDWTNTRISNRRDYCCKNSEYYKCPNTKIRLVT